jgi:hypothetical protein
MATIESLPAELRALARRVPYESRINQSIPELQARCEDAAGLLAEADTEADEARARRKRKEADRMLNSMSVETFLKEQGRLLDSIDKAKAVEGGYAVQALTEELQRLLKDHPQPWERLAGMLLEAATQELEIRQAAVRKPWPFSWPRKRG